VTLTPFQFEPIFQQYLWGGRRLAEWFPQAPADGPIAEAWLISDEAKFPSRVAQGPQAGRTLRELAVEFGPRLLGSRHRPGERFPLLLKLLDAREPLSVQVHPDDVHAGPGNSGKTEAWVVLHAERGARIYAGLRDGVDERSLRDAIEANRVVEVLHSFEPKVGECVFLPAGTVHALGAGLLVFEVQQTSDITYRLHDWGRVDARTGRPRELHIEQGVACIDWFGGPAALVIAPDGLLVDCPQFRLWRKRSATKNVRVGAADEFRIVAVVDGRGLLDFGSERELLLEPGTTWLLPPGSGKACCYRDGSLTLLECGPPAEGAL
jgi:mannose-6-phosphate isomerase